MNDMTIKKITVTYDNFDRFKMSISSTISEFYDRYYESPHIVEIYNKETLDINNELMLKLFYKNINILYMNNPVIRPVIIMRSGYSSLYHTVQEPEDPDGHKELTLLISEIEITDHIIAYRIEDDLSFTEINSSKTKIKLEGLDL